MRRFTNFMKMLGVTIIVCASILPAMAQDATGECDMPGLIEEIQARIDNLNDNQDEQIRGLAGLSLYIDAEIIKCNGLTFSDQGMQVLGPFEIPAGIYRVHLQTEGNFDTDIAVINGECVGAAREDKIFGYIGHDDATNGIEALFSSQGCTVLLQISASDAPWDLWFERMI